MARGALLGPGQIKKKKVCPYIYQNIFLYFEPSGKANKKSTT